MEDYSVRTLIAPTSASEFEKDSILWRKINFLERQNSEETDPKLLRNQFKSLDLKDPLSFVRIQKWITSLPEDYHSKDNMIYELVANTHNEIIKNTGSQFISINDFKITFEESKDTCWLNLKRFRDRYGIKIHRANDKLFSTSNLSYIVALTNKYNPPSLSRYLSIRTKEFSEGYISNGFLLINFEQVGERIIEWDKFLSAFPDSEYKSEIINRQKDYLKTFLYGTKNSGLFDESNRMLLPVIKKDYEQFIKNHPDFPATEIIKKRYSELKLRNFIDEK